MVARDAVLGQNLPRVSSDTFHLTSFYAAEREIPPSRAVKLDRPPFPLLFIPG